MTLLRTSGAPGDDDGGKWCKEHIVPSSNWRWTVCCYFKACCCLLLINVVSDLNLLELIISMYSISSIFASEGYGKKCCDECSSHPEGVTHNTEQELPFRASHKDNLDKLDGLLPDVKGRIVEHLDYENIFNLKSLSKNWKALIESKECIQALALKVKPVLTACSFFIHKGVWQWAAFDPNSNSTSGHKGKWRKLPPLTFLPPNCDPDSDLFKQFLFCANEGLVCMNFSKSTHQERLIAFNPLTEQWKELPPLLHRRNPVLMHMYVDHFSKSYHILVAGSSASGEESLSRITELYDSQTGQWERVGDFSGPAFALNEYQSGVFQNGHTFCVGFLELGDQIVNGILGYNVEGVWSTKWTAEAVPISTILQLVENNGDLFLFSEQDNGPLIEHWVDRIEWTPSEGDSEEKTDTFTLVNVLKCGGRSLEVYSEFALVHTPWELPISEEDPEFDPEFASVPLSESQVCIYSTVDLTVILIGASSLENRPSNPGRSIWCFILGTVVGILTHLNVVEASPASTPGPSSSQTSSTLPTLWYWSSRATIASLGIAALMMCITIYMCVCPRERGDNMCGVLRELTRPIGGGPRSMCVSVGSVKVGEASVDALKLRSSLGSSPGSSPASSPRSSLV